MQAADAILVVAWDAQDMPPRAVFTLGSCIGAVADALPDLAAAVERAATSLERHKLSFQTIFLHTTLLLASCCDVLARFCIHVRKLAAESSPQLEAEAKLLLLACGRRWRSLPEVMELTAALAL